MNELMLFGFKDTKIRTLIINDEPFFVGKDVAEALGYQNTRDALKKRVDDEDKGVANCDTLGGSQEMTVINESGVYSLVFGSKLPQAKEFKHWVTSEVLPQLRKTGRYQLPKTYSQALRALADIEEQKELLELENKVMQPKAEYFDELVDKHLLTNFRDTAKQLHIMQKDFITFLLNKNYIYRDARGKLKPFKSFVEKGLFELKDFSSKTSDYADLQTLITPKGKETFRLLINEV